MTYHLLRARPIDNVARTQGDAFAGYVEAERTFPPTYKFDKRSDVYDTSEKRSVPSGLRFGPDASGRLEGVRCGPTNTSPFLS